MTPVNDAIRPGDLVRLRERTDNGNTATTATVLEVFADPKAPLAYVAVAGEHPHWVFASSLEVLAAADEGDALQPSA